MEPAAASVSKERFSLLSAQAQKALWHPSSLYFFYGLSVIISLPDRILAGSYNRIYFQGSHFMTRKAGSGFPSGSQHHMFISSYLVLLNPVLYLAVLKFLVFQPALMYTWCQIPPGKTELTFLVMK